MATVREGTTGALMVVDVQVGVVKDAWDASRIVKNVARAVERARAQGVPVIWVQHSDENLIYGSPDWQWVPELTPAEGEPLIHEHFNSSFEQDHTRNRTGPSWSDPYRPGGRRHQLVHSGHGLCCAGTRLRPDTG